jgi:hypothetical protein
MCNGVAEEGIELSEEFSTVALAVLEVVAAAVVLMLVIFIGLVIIVGVGVDVLMPGCTPTVCSWGCSWACTTSLACTLSKPAVGI